MIKQAFFVEVKAKGQKVLGFENRIKFRHILAWIFFSLIHISKLLYWLVILGKTSKRLNTQSVGPSEPKGQEGREGGAIAPSRFWQE